MMEMIKQDNLEKYKRLSQIKDVIDNEPKEVQTSFELVEAYFFEMLDKNSQEKEVVQMIHHQQNDVSHAEDNLAVQPGTNKFNKIMYVVKQVVANKSE